MANVILQDGFRQVCVWPSTIVGERVAEFVEWMKETFNIRVQYLEEIVTDLDSNDLFFAVHNDDVNKFTVPRLEYGIRWVEDVFFNRQGDLYPDRVSKYQSWNPDGNDDENF